MIYTAPCIMFCRNGYARIQNIMYRAVYHRRIGCFMQMSPLVTLTGCILGRSRAHTVGGGGAGDKGT